MNTAKKGKIKKEEKKDMQTQLNSKNHSHIIEHHPAPGELFTISSTDRLCGPVP